MSALWTEDLIVSENLFPIIAMDFEGKQAVLRRTFSVNKTVLISQLEEKRCALAFLWKALRQNQSSKTAGPFRVRLFEFILSFG